MTNPRPGSKADYKKRLENASEELRRLRKLEYRFMTGIAMIESIGYEEVTTPDPFLGYDKHSWELTEAAKEARAAEQRSLEDAHKAAARAETLATVIEALEIPGYANGGYLLDFSNAYSPKISSPSYDTDRFWTDLNTALDVREDRKRAELRAATEERVRTIGGVHVTIDGFALAKNLPYGDKSAAPAAKPKKPKGAKRTERGYN